MPVVVNIEAIDHPFEFHINPLNVECEQELYKWLDNVGGLKTEEDRKFFADLQIVQCVSTIHPNASLQQLLCSAKICAVGVYADDYFDRNCGVNHIITRVERFKAILKGENIEAENLFEKLSYDLFMETMASFDENQKNWLRRKIADYFRSYVWQNKLKRQKRIPEIGEYIAMRGYTVCNDFAIEVNEFIARINLPFIAKCDQSVMNMAFLANQITWLINDMVSLENDVNSDFPANIIVSIKTSRKCGWQQAADEAHQMLLDSVEEFKCWEKNVTKFYDEAVDEKVKEYIFYLKNTANANVNFHYRTNRYKFKKQQCLKSE